ncbi:FtsQ-type POTRA domain-containing protein [Pseudokineococcus sp. 5B2Z-1]|uniref:cell division protein FtsQ/DivIB n=1 Tax=Pseudokineococcus sp. 5B2Z-1 TaxID=3132744 RepID=UPI0030A35446
MSRRPLAPRARPAAEAPPAADPGLAPGRTEVPEPVEDADEPTGAAPVDDVDGAPERRDGRPRPPQGGLPPRPRGGSSPVSRSSSSPVSRSSSSPVSRPGSPGPVHLRRSSAASAAAPSGAAPAAVLGRRRAAAAPTDTARRFAERARARRRLALRPLLAVLAALVVVAGLAYVLLWSPLLVVREVGVVGVERLERPAVAELVEPAVGTPLARVDTAALEEVVEQVPLVETATVARVWPSGLEVRVVERVPVAAVADPAGGYSVVDRTGLTVLHEAEVPTDVPLVAVDLGSARPGTVEAVTRVLDGLPPQLREQVATAGGTSPDDVVLQLRSGARVVWGGAEQTPVKADVLTALLQRPAAVYDVSSPAAPVTREG